MTTRPSIIFTLGVLAGCCPTAQPHICVEVTARTFKVERIVDGDTFKDYLTLGRSSLRSNHGGSIMKHPFNNPPIPPRKE